jgi:hypothetical protein
MARLIWASVAGLLAAGSASADFIGVDIREDVDMTNAPAGARTFSFYAMFDGQGIHDEVLLVGMEGLEGGFGIDTVRNPGADFYQELQPVLRARNDTAPMAALIDMSPTFRFDTFVDIGMRSVSEGIETYTQLDPLFAFEDTDGSGGEDHITPAWFNSNPLGDQGEAGLDGDVFLAQLTIIGVADNASIVNFDHDTGVVTSSIFTGSFFVATQGDRSVGEPPALFQDISFQSSALAPTPGTVMLFGLGGVAAMRRRRLTARAD